MNNHKTFGSLFLLAFAGSSLAQISHFTPGRLVFTQVGSETLANTGNTVSIREVVKTGSSMTPTTLFSLPNLAANLSPTNTLVQSGTATSEGFITRSTSGRFLGIVGYSGTHSTSVTGAASATINRIVGRIDFAGGINVSTRLTNAHSGNNIRAGVWTETPVPDGTNLRYRAFTVGGSGGFVASILGATSGTTVSSLVETSSTTTATSANLRSIRMVNGNLYGSTSSTTLGLSGIRKLSGLPTASTNQTRLIQTDTATSAHASPYSFVFIKATETIAGTPTEVVNCYIADDNNNVNTTPPIAANGGIWKYQSTTGIDGTFTQKYRVSSTACRHICTDGKVIYGVTGSGSTQTQNQIMQFIDGGSGTTANTTEVSLISSVSNSQAIRGIELSPEPAVVDAQYSSGGTSGSTLVLRQDDGMQRSLRVGLVPDSDYRSWTNYTTINYDGHAAKTATDSSGNVYIAIQSAAVSNTEILPTVSVLRVPVGGGSSTVVGEVTNLVAGSEVFGLTIDSSGRPIVAYKSNVGAANVKFVRYATDGTATIFDNTTGWASGSKTPLDLSADPNGYLTVLFGSGNALATLALSDTFPNASASADVTVTADSGVALTPLRAQYGSDGKLRVLSVGSTTATRALLRVDTLATDRLSIETFGQPERRDATGTSTGGATTRAATSPSFLWAWGLSMAGNNPRVLMTGTAEPTTGPSGPSVGSANRNDNIIGSGRVWTFSTANVVSNATYRFAPGFSPVN
jgi:hypothetical protein